MQHLEVSCAVRRFFKTLGFKGLKFRYTRKYTKYRGIFFFFRQWEVLNFLHFVFNIILMLFCVFVLYCYVAASSVATERLLLTFWPVNIFMGGVPP